ncbi:hypothetical protein PT7_0304 [Pusillimonas sp. T7-7]|uniref:hypothetical protein n=1 Tax=Pusillimonas sp. (strain T7-7) TaxID=1007105 RepID=UPI0002084C3B|nr:hypothetical protein [Pusillimonas sp. T7-7]AEC18844.1 hypothetical protein PT7_0304 [Pusillimonas sp. T7-7]
MKHEHSLRNEHVGQAYMIMLDLYDECRGKNMSADKISQHIQNANPWGSGQSWMCRAWRIAEKEFCKDYGLPLHRSTCSKSSSRTT